MSVSKRVKRLPFVVSPRLEPVTETLGTKESGQIKIERKGYLTVAEKAYSKAALQGDESIGAIRRLAFRVSRETGKDIQDVLRDVTTGGLDSYLEPYGEEIEGCMTLMTSYQERRAIIAATTLLVYRVDPEWGIDDTLAMHPDLRDALHLLYEEEEVKNIEALEQISKDKGEKVDESGK